MTDEEPSVSVIIPTYGHRDFVLEAIGSVLIQTFQNFEIIVVNDGSLDDTAEVLGQLRADGKIRYFEQANAGQATARNRGLSEAVGEFIAFLDDDDIWPPGKLEWQVKLLVESGAVAVGGAVALLGEVGLKDDSSARIETLGIRQIFDGCPFASPGQALIRRAVLLQMGGLDEALWGTDDYDLWFRLARDGIILRSERISLLYRVHANNASRAIGRMLSNGVRTVEKNAADFPRYQHREFRRAGYRFLYRHFGSRAIRGFSENLVLKKFHNCFAQLYDLKPLWMHLLCDPGLWKNIASDLLRRQDIPSSRRSNT